MRTQEVLLRARIIANVAMSADGKIDTAAREGGGFSSRLDRDRLDQLRAEADALVVGAGTVRAEDPPLTVRDPGRRHQRVTEGKPEQLHAVVLSRSGLVPAGARFFREPAGARTLAVPADVPEANLAPLRDLEQRGELEILRCGTGQVDVRQLVAHLVRAGRKLIVVEGGGETIASFVEAGLLDEIRITLCPTFLGGRTAPTPLDGAGWPMAARRRLNLTSFERVGDELFLRYTVGPPLEKGGASVANP
ncbi:MAG: dihydrofolate reductase family protein [Acidobacteria bacterium]|nr:dihydrofolate reductase family protein [Acidobacteriota bacterium]